MSGARARLAAATASLVVAVGCTVSMPPRPADAGGASDGGGASDAGAASDAGGFSDAGGPVILVGPAAGHSFQPAMLVVPAGTTVRWFWESAGHNLISGVDGTPDGQFCAPADDACTSAATASLTFAAGTTYEHTFTTPGTYPYYCAPHVSDGMKGTIVVQ